jgi:two-component system sensor histidine kinase ChiS
MYGTNFHAEKPALIVVADDDRAIAELLSSVLSDEGYAVLCCSSEREAYQAVVERKPVLVILDLQMEHAESGLLVLDALRHNQATQHIPAIIYSANHLFLRQQRAELQQHNCEILEKPFNLFQLIEMVERLVAREREV